MEVMDLTFSVLFKVSNYTQTSSTTDLGIRISTPSLSRSGVVPENRLSLSTTSEPALRKNKDQCRTPYDSANCAVLPVSDLMFLMQLFQVQ